MDDEDYQTQDDQTQDGTENSFEEKNPFFSDLETLMTPGLEAYARDPREAFLIRQAQTKEAERKKLWDAEINRLKQARDKLLNKPQGEQRAEMLRQIATRLRTPPKETDPRFWERRNIFSTLRDIADVSRERDVAQKAAEEEAKKYDDLIAKYGYKQAEQEAQAAARAVEKYRPAASGPKSEFERMIADLPEAEQKRLRRNRAEILSTRGSGAVAQWERTVQAIVNKKKGVATEEDLAVLELASGKKGNLTLSQQRTDADILKARSFIKGFNQQQIDMAFRKGQYRSAIENDIVNAYNLARKKTYQEMLASGEVSAPMSQEGGAEVIEEEMPE